MASNQAFADKPIIYHSGIEDHFDGWAADCGCKIAELRRLGEQAIRNRHDRATMLDQARGRQPDVCGNWTLASPKADFAGWH